MTSVWDENQTPLRRVITDHVTKVIGKKKTRSQSDFGTQFEDKGVAIEKAMENIECPEKRLWVAAAVVRKQLL